MGESAVKGKLVNALRSHYFGRPYNIKCLFPDLNGRRVAHGLYDIPSILNTLHINLYEIRLEAVRKRERFDVQR